MHNIALSAGPRTVEPFYDISQCVCNDGQTKHGKLWVFLRIRGPDAQGISEKGAMVNKARNCESISLLSHQLLDATGYIMIYQLHLSGLIEFLTSNTNAATSLPYNHEQHPITKMTFIPHANCPIPPNYFVVQRTSSSGTWAQTLRCTSQETRAPAMDSPEQRATEGDVESLVSLVLVDLGDYTILANRSSIPEGLQGFTI